MLMVLWVRSCACPHDIQRCLGMWWHGERALRAQTNLRDPKSSSTEQIVCIVSAHISSRA